MVKASGWRGKERRNVKKINKIILYCLLVANIIGFIYLAYQGNTVPRNYLSRPSNCTDPTQITSPTAPTLDEVIQFLNQDDTNTHKYIRNLFDCKQFSGMLQSRMESVMGWEAYGVSLDFFGLSDGHMVVGIMTSDRGFVYIEPIYDLIIDVPLGGNECLPNGTSCEPIINAFIISRCIFR